MHFVVPSLVVPQLTEWRVPLTTDHRVMVCRRRGSAGGETRNETIPAGHLRVGQEVLCSNGFLGWNARFQMNNHGMRHTAAANVTIFAASEMPISEELAQVASLIDMRAFTHHWQLGANICRVWFSSGQHG